MAEIQDFIGYGTFAARPTTPGASSAGVSSRYFATDTSTEYCWNGSAWVAVGAGGSSTLAGDTDANISSPANGDLLQYSTSDSKWHNKAGVVPAELGYVQATSNFTGAGSGTDVAVTSMTLTVTVGTRPIVVTFYCPYAAKGSVAGAISVKLHDDTAGAFVALGQLDCSPNLGGPLHLPARLAPSAGSRAYTIYAQYSSGGTAATLFAGATDPMWLQAREV